jgi:hypothetical protein
MQYELPLIERQIETFSISQRAHDGYVNATALCRAAGKLFADYQRLNTTLEFLRELNFVMGIPITELIQIVKGGYPELQGTWVHPQVAIHLGQWASPKFAVQVSKWIFEWMNGAQKNNYKFPYHLRRYIINRDKIPHTHFSMLDQMTVKLLAGLETHGYIIPHTLMPDISLGVIFSGWLREQGYDPDSFPTYQHVFDDGRRPVVGARLYPNELMTMFNQKLEDWIRKGEALKYFSKRDPEAIEPLKKVLLEIRPVAKVGLGVNSFCKSKGSVGVSDFCNKSIEAREKQAQIA